MPTVASAAGQENSTGKSAESGSFAPPSLQKQDDDSGLTPHWTFSAQGILLERIGGGANRALVARVSGSEPFLATFITPGIEAFNSRSFDRVFRPDRKSV
jgi:hypothetical protein